MSHVPPEIAADPKRLAIYRKVLKEDGSPRFAEMCAMQQAPGSKGTDRAFSEGAWRQMESMDKWNRDNIVKIAKKAGINTAGKCYKGGLGHYTDPAAWVSTADDVLAVAKARNLTVTGAVTHQGHVSEPKRIKLAKDVVERHAQRELQRDPALAARVKKNPKLLNSVREKVAATHSKQR